MKTVLAIAGFDPSGYAGIGADLSTFKEFGLRGVGVVTAVTAQDTRKVTGVWPLTPHKIKKQLETLLAESTPRSVKIGMLGTSENADAVRSVIKRHGLDNVVLDPVLKSSGGKSLMGGRGIAAIKKLLPHVAVVTPNTLEAEALGDIRVRTLDDTKDAAIAIHSLGASCVVVKGGHLGGRPVDILFDGKNLHCFEGERIRAARGMLHGTGCLFSSAIAASLAKQTKATQAVKEAKAHVVRTITERTRR